MIECNADDSATAAQNLFLNLCPEQEIVIARPNLKKGENFYCTYWISREEGHFEQQGCRFKHEMPDLKTMGIIMGRPSFPKWLLESIGPVLAPPPYLRPAVMSNRQQGKHRAIAPKPSALPAPINMHTNSATTNSSIVLQAPAEGFSNMDKPLEISSRLEKPSRFVHMPLEPRGSGQ